MTQHDLDQDPRTPPDMVVCGNSYLSQFYESPVIQAWDGVQWTAVGRLERRPFSNLICRDVLSCDLDGEGRFPPQLYASGAIQLGSIHAGVVRWTGADWIPVGGSTGSSDVVHAIELYDPDDTGPAEALLVAGGTFQFLGGMSPINLAAWNGREWTAIGTPNQAVSALKSHDFDGPGPQPPELLVGGAFTSIGAMPASHVARWNGASWSSLAGGTNGGAYDFTAFDPDGAGPLPTRLVVTGLFTVAGGVPCNYIAQTDGKTWEPFAGGLGSTGQALAAYDPDRDGPLAPQLAVGGSFLFADNQPSAFFARWGFESTPFHPADSDCSGTIDGIDLAALLGQWSGSATYSPCPPFMPSDLNQDCRINGFDLALLLGAWAS